MYDGGLQRGKARVHGDLESAAHPSVHPSVLVSIKIGEHLGAGRFNCPSTAVTGRGRSRNHRAPPIHGRFERRLGWCCIDPDKGDSALCSQRRPVCGRQHRPSPGCLGQPVRRSGVGFAAGAVGTWSSHWARLATIGRPIAGRCSSRLANAPGVRRRSLWRNLAGVRWTLAVPLRAASDASPRTSSRCSPAPSVRWRQPSSVAA